MPKQVPVLVLVLVLVQVPVLVLVLVTSTSTSTRTSTGTWFGTNGHFRRDPDVISRMSDTTTQDLSVFIGFTI